MPELCRFHDIVIRMFHAVCWGRDNAAIGIDKLEVLAGRLPRREMSLVIKWAKLHQRELRDAWRRWAGEARRRSGPVL